MSPTREPAPPDAALSYVSPTPTSPWGTYLSQVDRVVPYLCLLYTSPSPRD